MGEPLSNFFVYAVPALTGLVVAFLAYRQASGAKRYSGAGLITLEETTALLHRQLENSNKILDLLERRLEAHEALDDYRVQNLQLGFEDLEKQVRRWGHSE